MDLFTPIIPIQKQHKNFQLINSLSMSHTATVVQSWSNGFPDIDNDFIKELQGSFYSSFWKLYLHALFQKFEFRMSWNYSSPDFVIEYNDVDFIVEASTVNKDHNIELSEWGTEVTAEVIDDYLNNMDDYYRYSIIRLSNTFKNSLEEYKSKYYRLPHIKNKPFVLAIAPFEQPLHDFIYDRAFLALLYDLYVPEEIAKQDTTLLSNRIPYVSLEYVEKDDANKIMLGLFNDDSASEISAIIFNHMATVGKAGYLSEGSGTTQHMWEENRSLVKTINEQELLEDGLFIFHNPFAKNKLPREIFSKNRVCQVFMDKETLTVSKYYGDKHLFTRGVF
ncbi:MAG: hypothetical protein ACI9RG_000521 [Sulfurimonas sp.]|jgi:hypothetical protein